MQVDVFGDYCNGEPGKPLLVSLLCYLDADWPRELDAETLFLDTDTEVGLVVRPKRQASLLARTAPGPPRVMREASDATLCRY